MYEWICPSCGFVAHNPTQHRFHRCPESPSFTPAPEQQVDFVDPDNTRTKVWKRGIFVGWDAGFAVVRIADYAYKRLLPCDIRPAKRTSEEIAWEAVCDYYDQSLDVEQSQVSWNADARTHAIILAAIKEACDD